MAEAVKPENRIQVLLSGLPESWSSVRDAIDAQPHLSPDDILSILEEKEIGMPRQPKPEEGSEHSAHAARAMQRQLKGRRRTDNTELFKVGQCTLCQGKGHMLANCQYLEPARSIVLAFKDAGKAKAFATMEQSESEEGD